MKKLLLVSSLIAIISTSSVNAKTQGSYLGIEALRTSADVETKKTAGTNTDRYFNNESKNSSTGFGVNYKYAINFNNFFVAPGLFYNHVGIDAEVDDKANLYTQNVKVNNFYGAKVDLGFDISEKFAVYAPVGVGIANYEIETKDYLNAANYLNTKTTGRSAGLVYGIGFAFYPIEQMAINFEYNRSNLSLETGGDVALFGTAELEAQTNLDFMKIGVSYRF